jgi:hypothetical protein
MMQALFGNESVEKALFYLLRYQQGYALGMAQFNKMPVSAMQRQLQRLETGSIVVSHLVGKTRVYQFNPRYPFLSELLVLLEKAFLFLPPAVAEHYAPKRTRPRRSGKP